MYSLIKNRFKHKKININNSCFANTMIIFVFIVIVLKQFNIINTQESNLVYTILGSISLIYVLIKTKFKKHIYLLLFILLYTISCVMSMLYNNNADIVELLWPLSFMNIALLLLNFNINIKIIRALYYPLLVIVILNFRNYNFMLDINSISVFMLLILGIYVIVSYQNNSRLTIIPYLGAFYSALLTVSLYTGGRSGVLVFSFLLICYISKYLFNINVMSKILAVIVLLCVLMTYVPSDVVFFDENINSSFANLQARGLKSERIQIWDDYLTKTQLSFFDIIFGSRISGTPTLNKYPENLHNSFFMLHAKYGLFMLVLVFILVCNTFIFLITKKHYDLLFIFLAVIIRMNLDYTNFNSIMDVLLIYFLFMPCYKNNSYPCSSGENKKVRPLKLKYYSVASAKISQQNTDAL